MNEYGPGETVTGLALVELPAGVTAKIGVLDPVEGKLCSLQPTEFSQRGRETVLARIRSSAASASRRSAPRRTGRSLAYVFEQILR
jgi:hypothetical protein